MTAEGADTLPGALVLGGGLAGAAAAIWLARAGHRVTLWERARTPQHKICGEFLSWEAQAYLKDLGLDLAALGAVPITRVRLVTAARIAAGPLGFTARSLTRRTLDAALLDRAEAAGVTVGRGVTAADVSADGTVRAGQQAVRPERLLLATGKHNLRGTERRDPDPRLARAEGNELGFKSYFRLAPAARAALAGHVELYLFQGGYAGLQLVERDAANLCFLVDAARYQRCGGDFAALLADLGAELPALAERLAGAVPLLDRPLAISAVPYGFLHRPGRTGGGTLYRLGDQAVVIPSFTGEGMSLALHSARLAARAIVAGESADIHARRFARDAAGPLWRALRMQELAERGWGEHAARLGRVVPALFGLGAGATRLPFGKVRRALAA